MVFDVGPGRGVVGPVPGQAHEGGLVEPKGAGLFQPFAVCVEEGGAGGGHGVVDRVPITGEPSATSLTVRPSATWPRASSGGSS